MSQNANLDSLSVEFQAVRYLLPTGKAALDNVSFRIHPGEKIALLGENGSGKTTVALLLAGVLTTSSGFIRWQSPPEPASVQLLLQNPTMQTLGSTVEEELRFGPEILRWETGRIDSAIYDSINTLGLNRNHPLAKLSGGELQQVVGTAIRLLSPQLLIYDEPAMYLYPPRRKDMIDAALREKCAVLWLTPSRTEANNFPRTIELRNGEVVFDGKSSNGQSAIHHAKTTIQEKNGKNETENITLRNIQILGEGKKRLELSELSIHEGERIGVVGDNGSGKTTLLALLGKVLYPDNGAIERTSGFPLTALAFQFPEMAFITSSVREEIGGPDPHENERIASERLLRFGLEPTSFLDRDPFTLSGGEARRVALAATVHSTETFLLWDEPTAGLDENGSRAIAELLQSQTAGFVVAGHDFNLIKSICERVIVLDNGKIVSDLPVDRWEMMK